MSRIAVVLSVLAPLSLVTPALADSAPQPALRGVTQVDVLPDSAFSAPAESISHIIYLNRCKGGCTVTSSDSNSAANQESTIPMQPAGTQVMVSEFAFDDTMWNDVVQCVKEIYSPFDVQIVDVDPGPTVVHHESIVAGHPTELGIPPPAPGAIVLGKAAVNGDHTAKNNDISWVFANAFTLYPTRALQVSQLCSTIGQETAHSWGLDHQWDCTDPMTYLNDCGGQKFFRNQNDPCGTGDVPSPQCNCDGGCSSSGPTQNSHAMILSVFGPGQSIVPGPTVALITPKDGDTVTSGFIADISSTTKRGTFKVDLILNGYTWATQKVSTDPMGAAKSPIYAATFALNAPTNVPDGVIDVEVRACDDIDQCASAKATVTKGAPCTDASTCAKGQKCEAGKCFWDTATGEVGDACDYPQACKTGICFGATGSSVCTQNCFTGIAGQCPDGFACELDATKQGHCLIGGDGGGGCCSASDESAGATLARGGLAGFVVLLVFGRRRRRGSRDAGGIDDTGRRRGSRDAGGIDDTGRRRGSRDAGGIDDTGRRRGAAA